MMHKTGKVETVPDLAKLTNESLESLCKELHAKVCGVGNDGDDDNIEDDNNNNDAGDSMIATVMMTATRNQWRER